MRRARPLDLARVGGPPPCGWEARWAGSRRDENQRPSSCRPRRVDRPPSPQRRPFFEAVQRVGRPLLRPFANSPPAEDANGSFPLTPPWAERRTRFLPGPCPRGRDQHPRRTGLKAKPDPATGGFMVNPARPRMRPRIYRPLTGHAGGASHDLIRGFRGIR